MNRYSYTSIQPRPSCMASFQIFYGIGKIKAMKLNAFLLNHPLQSIFTYDFRNIMYSSTFLDIWQKIPRNNKIRYSIENHLRHKSLIYCYQAYRMFQNLPTKGQRTKANGNSILNCHPYKALQVNLSQYHELEIAYKKKELLENERYDELKIYTETQETKDKMKKVDQKQKKKLSKQTFIKNQRNKK